MLTKVRNALARHPRYRRMRDFLTPPGYEGARWTARKLLNVYLSRWEEGHGRTKLRSYPFKLTVEATGACNLRCPACFTGVGDVGRPGSAMPLDLYRRVLAELGDYLFELEFYNWGEPLLAKNIYTMIAEASARGISTTVSTNFSFPFDAERAERLVTSGLTVLGVSIDGARQESYEQYRVGGKLDRVLANCRLVADAKRRLGSKWPRLVWEFHVFAHNVADVELAKTMASELDMELAVNKGWTVGAEWNPESEYRFFWYPSPPTRCRFLWQQAVVNNDGGVAPCCGTFFREDDVGHLAVQAGDLGAASFREVWNGPKFQAARGFYRARTGTDETRQLICFDCPLTKVWEKWQRHQEAGGTLAGFDPGYSTNECFNYFWNRRPARAVSGAAPAS